MAAFLPAFFHPTTSKTTTSILGQEKKIFLLLTHFLDFSKMSIAKDEVSRKVHKDLNPENEQKFKYRLFAPRILSLIHALVQLLGLS